MDPALRAIVAALRSGGMSDEALQQAMTAAELTSRPLRTVLVDDQVVTEFQLASAVAEAYGVEAVELSNFPVDPSAMTTIPLALARRHRMLPIAVNDTPSRWRSPTLATCSRSTTSGPPPAWLVRPMVVAKDDLTGCSTATPAHSTDLDEAAAQAEAEEDAGDSDGADSVNEDAPVVRYVNSLLERAITSRASDIHLEPSEHDLQDPAADRRRAARGRRGAARHPGRADLAAEDPVRPGHHRAPGAAERPDHRRTWAAAASTCGPRPCRRCGARRWCCGCSTPAASTSSCASSASPTTTTTGSPSSFRKPHGMVLVTGPTGSGKSTTLYATLGEIARPEVNVITVEDPVEYRMDGINQVQVNLKAGLTFAAVLPAILRSDPDVVLIGEIRDRATAQLAVEAALTGHLVLSTLHTNDAPSAMTRLVEMGIEPFLVGSSLDCRAGPAAGPQAVRVVQGGLRTDREGTRRRDLAIRDLRHAGEVLAGGRVPVLCADRIPGPAGG